jgi:hypothetical protein
MPTSGIAKISYFLFTRRYSLGMRQVAAQRIQGKRFREMNADLDYDPVAA